MDKLIWVALGVAGVGALALPKRDEIVAAVDDVLPDAVTFPPIWPDTDPGIPGSPDLPVPTPDEFLVWKISSWQNALAAGGGYWVIQPVLTVDDRDYLYATPKEYLNHLIQLRNAGAVNINSAIGNMSLTVEQWAPVVTVIPVANAGAIEVHYLSDTRVFIRVELKSPPGTNPDRNYLTVSMFTPWVAPWFELLHSDGRISYHHLPGDQVVATWLIDFSDDWSSVIRVTGKTQSPAGLPIELIATFRLDDLNPR